tara:strand:+ start:7632 stop:8171 length:540 start_codon:yes stop_codon:yes gene_type:complete
MDFETPVLPLPIKKLSRLYPEFARFFEQDKGPQGWSASIFGADVKPKMYASGSTTGASPLYDLPSGPVRGDLRNFGMGYGAGVNVNTSVGNFGLGGRGHVYSGSLSHPEELREYLRPGESMKPEWSGYGLDSIQGTYSSPPTSYSPQGKYSGSIDVHNNAQTSGFFEDPTIMGRVKIRF